MWNQVTSIGSSLLVVGCVGCGSSGVGHSVVAFFNSSDERTFL